MTRNRFGWLGFGLTHPRWPLQWGAKMCGVAEALAPHPGSPEGERLGLPQHLGIITFS
jgi:hypothetical protein